MHCNSAGEIDAKTTNKAQQGLHVLYSQHIQSIQQLFA